MNKLNLYQKFTGLHCPTLKELINSMKKRTFMQLQTGFKGNFSEFHIKGPDLPLIWSSSSVVDLITEPVLRQISRENPYFSLRNKNSYYTIATIRGNALISLFLGGSKKQSAIGFKLHIKGILLPLISLVEMLSDGTRYPNTPAGDPLYDQKYSSGTHLEAEADQELPK